MSVERAMLRESVRDRRRQHSSSDSGRVSVPMWDSSDPDRAPPPLPLNPANPNQSPTRPNTSAHVAAAAQALADRAREGNGPSLFTVNATQEQRSPTRSPQHKRLQSIQHGSLSSLKNSFENSHGNEWDSSRPTTPISMRDHYSNSPSPRSETAASQRSGKDLLENVPTLRPYAHAAPRSILSENTKPSATKLALENMAYRDSSQQRLSSNTQMPLADATNSSTNSSTRTPQNMDSIFYQMQHLTSIATTLQKEMAALSRRSKDNATDLVSLKEATNARDEDIRKSLRELVVSVRGSEMGLLGAPPRIDIPRPSSASGPPGQYLDNKPYCSPPAQKSFSIPRIMSPSASETHLEHERGIYPSSFSVEGAASLAMLEKVVRDMATKDGQELLLCTLSELFIASTKESSVSAKNVEEIAQFIRDRSASQALVRQASRQTSIGNQPPQLDLKFDDFDGANRGTGAQASTSPAPPMVSAEFLQLLQRINDSVSQSGEITGEIKTLVRELRGEVLGMGWDLGRKMEQIEPAESYHRHVATEDDLSHVVREGLAELKEQLDQIRRQSPSSATSESHEVVKLALTEHGADQTTSLQAQGPAFDPESILAAVREACESYKPEIELQQFGLERDEILLCLKEGLEEYQASKASESFNTVSREDIMVAVQQALQHFNHPAPAIEAAEIKEEVLATIRECLENFQSRDLAMTERGTGDITRNDILEAVKEGLGFFKHEAASEFDINRDDLFDATKAGLDNAQTPLNGIVNSVQDIVEEMRAELKQYSVENGKDSEQMLDAMREGLDTLRTDMEAYLDRSGAMTFSDEKLVDVKEGFDKLCAVVQESTIGATRGMDSDGRPFDETRIIAAVKEEFESLRATLAAPVLQYANAGDKDEILSLVKQSLDDLRQRLTADQSEAAQESLDLMKEELEAFRGRLGEHLSSPSPAFANLELLEAIRDGLDGLRIAAGRDGGEIVNAEALESIKEELEHLRQSIATTLVRGGSASHTDAILTLRDGLDEFKKQIDEKFDDAERLAPDSGEILDALNDGLSDLRIDIAKIAEHPVDMDMTVSYDILDTLKDGLSAIRADIEQLRSESSTAQNGEVVLADPSGTGRSRGLSEDTGAGPVKKDDLERLEVMLTQLSIKVVAMDHNIQSGVTLAALSADRLLGKDSVAGIEFILQDLQATVADIASHNNSADSNSVTKDDTDAIETLLQNTKAKIDNLVISALGSFQALDTAVGQTGESVEDLAARMKANMSTKEDIAAVGLLLQESATTLNDISHQIGAVKSASKEDLSEINAVCDEMKARIEKLPKSGTVPSKEDIEQVTAMIENLQKSQAKAHLYYEKDLTITAKAFDDRRAEAKTILAQIADLKGSVEASKDELQSRMSHGNQDVRALDEILRGIEEKIDNAPNAISDIQKIMKIVNREFERAHESLGGVQTKSDALLEKHELVRAAIVVEIGKKVDERFQELMVRHDEQHQAVMLTANAVDRATRAVMDRAAEQEDLLSASRSVAENLKITIDTLEAAVTDISPALTEATERMSDDAKTVFNKVVELSARLDDSHLDSRNDHQRTRDEVLKSWAVVDGLHQEIRNTHPKFTELLADILAITEEHFEISKSQAIESKRFKDGVATVPLPRLEACPAVSTVYDDTTLHRKLDELLAKATTADKSPANLGRLDEIHEQVMNTAAEVSAFVAFHTKVATAVHDNKEDEVHQASLDLNKFVIEKEELETKVINLRDAKQVLASDIESLMAETDSLKSQKLRLTAEVSSLQTALSIRREELQLMDARADALERRIIEGVMDHSRALLLTQKPRSVANMNLKRVSSNSSHATVTTANPCSVVSNGIGMAMKIRPTNRRNAELTSASERRIVSLGQITSNVPNGGKGVAAGSHNIASGLSNLKRGQSMKTQLRKSTWAGDSSLLGHFNDQENMSRAEESDIESDIDERSQGTVTSLANRSASYTGTQVSRSEQASSYGNGSSEYSFGMGSYLTGIETDRRTSYESTVRSKLGAADSQMDSEVDSDEGSPVSEEEAEDEQAEEEAEDEQADEEAEDGEEAANSTGQELVLATKDVGPRHSIGYDSGLGSDLPTTALSGMGVGGDYFPAILEE